MSPFGMKTKKTKQQELTKSSTIMGSPNVLLGECCLKEFALWPLSWRTFGLDWPKYLHKTQQPSWSPRCLSKITSIPRRRLEMIRNGRFPSSSCPSWTHCKLGFRFLTDRSGTCCVVWCSAHSEMLFCSAQLHWVVYWRCRSLPISLKLSVLLLSPRQDVSIQMFFAFCTTLCTQLCEHFRRFGNAWQNHLTPTPTNKASVKVTEIPTSWCLTWGLTEALDLQLHALVPPRDWLFGSSRECDVKNHSKHPSSWWMNFFYLFVYLKRFTK